MTKLEYFRTRLDATTTSVEVMSEMRSNLHGVCVVDVRNGPATLLIDRIAGALQIPQSEILAQ